MQKTKLILGIVLLATWRLLQGYELSNTSQAVLTIGSALVIAYLITNRNSYTVNLIAILASMIIINIYLML